MSMEQFEQFAEDLGITMTAKAIVHRPDQDPTESESNWSKDADHFMVTLERVPEGTDPNRPTAVIWTGYYSTGAAHPVLWAGDAKRCKNANARRAYRGLMNKAPSGRVTLHDDALRKEIRRIYQAAAPLPIGDVLWSLQMDSHDWESTFEDWCDCMGYDSDSRKAESIFKACQDTAKTLRRNLGVENFDRFMSLEEV